MRGSAALTRVCREHGKEAALGGLRSGRHLLEPECDLVIYCVYDPGILAIRARERATTDDFL